MFVSLAGVERPDHQKVACPNKGAPTVHLTRTTLSGSKQNAGARILRRRLWEAPTGTPTAHCDPGGGPSPPRCYQEERSKQDRQVTLQLRGAGGEGEVGGGRGHCGNVGCSRARHEVSSCSHPEPGDDSLLAPYRPGRPMRCGQVAFSNWVSSRRLRLNSKRQNSARKKQRHH